MIGMLIGFATGLMGIGYLAAAVVLLFIADGEFGGRAFVALFFIAGAGLMAALALMAFKER